MTRPGPALAVLRAALDAQWQVLLMALPTLDPGAPTRVAGWDVGRVHSHLTATTDSLTAVLAAPGPARADTDLAGWAAALPALAASIDAQARAGAADLPGAVQRARAALSAAQDRGDTATRTVTQRTGSHLLTDAVLFRLIEAVVHGVDLGLTPDPAALKQVVRALVGLLAVRAPGHAVELRVPPYAVTQCVAGPRHTRGTPPGTVEADPIGWLLVATGRLGWDEAVATGQLRVRGDRADLREHLPLLS